MSFVGLCRHLLQNAATTGNGAEADLKGASQHVSIYITGSAGVSAGAVQLESAPTPAYAGTWAAHGSPVVVAASTTKIVQVVGSLGVIRARISTTVADGTVSVTAFAN